MLKVAGAVVFSLLLQTSNAETRIVEYLKANVVPGRAVVVSDLYNNVFKIPEERKVLDRLYSTFFKIPMFVVQYNTASKKIPTLQELSEQFNFTVPGEADVILRIMEAIRECQGSSSVIRRPVRLQELISRESKPALSSAESLRERSRA